nr:hypothetical protein [uncultured Shinella sp.]
MSLISITEALGQFVLVVLALSTVLTVADAAGLLPAPLAGWLARNRISHTIAVLRELGWEPKRVRSAFELSKLQRLVPFKSNQTEAALLTTEADLKTSVRVGGTKVVTAKTFIDVMGMSADPRFAVRTARALAARWRELAQQGKVDPTIDGIAGLKGGSPFVAYELAKLLERPLIIHSNSQKFDSDKPLLQGHFDTALNNISSLRFLLVDDSTTGGAKAIDAIADIREFGGTVDTMLVLFIPTEKDPAGLLKQVNVDLYSASLDD